MRLITESFMQRRPGVAAIALFTDTNVSTKDEWTVARQAHEQGDYAAEARCYKELAERGDPRAQNNLGVMYDTRRGVPKDFVEAMKWFRRAAELGNGAAQANLASMYFNGHGVPANLAEAAKWYRKAAQNGIGYAQYQLGTCTKAARECRSISRRP